MRLARFLLAGCIGLGLLAALALLVLPSVLDWGRYRPSLEALASTTIGHPVTIEGSVGLSLLPEPVLTAAKVGVADISGGGSLSAHTLRLRVAFWPLLAGRIQPRELVLREPSLRLPWPLPPRTLADWPRARFASFSARIENGTLAIGRLEAAGIDAVLGVSETGALSAAGTARLSAAEWRFNARLTSPGADGATGLDMAMDGEDKASGAGASFSGQIAADGSLAGRFVGRGPDLSQILPAPAAPFQIQAALTGASGLIAANELSLDLGDTRARGAAALRVSPSSRLDVALQASRLALDAWLPLLLRNGPAPLPVEVDLTADTATLAGGVLRHLRAVLDIGGNEAVLREGSVVLPGEASLALSGSLTHADEGQPRFSGTAHLDAPSWRTTLRWLAQAAWPGFAGLPAGVLRTVSLDGQVNGRPGEVEVADLRGQIDGADVSGVLAFKSHPVPSIGADLSFPRLNLDPWLPAAAPTLPELSRAVAGVGADIRIRAEHATLQTIPLQGVTAEATVKDGRLTLRDLQLASLGVHVAGSGALEAGGRLADGKLVLTSADAVQIYRWLPPAWRGTRALWNGPAALSVTAAGPPEALGLTAALDLADARLEAQPVVDLPRARWSGAATLRHPGAIRFFSLLGLASPDAAAWIGQGSLSGVAHLSYSPGRLAAQSFELIAGSARLGGQLALDEQNEEPSLTGLIVADVLPLPALDPRSTAPLSLDFLHGWRASVRLEAAQVLFGLSPQLAGLACTVEVSSASLRLEQATARVVGGGDLSLSAVLEAGATPPALAVDAAAAGVPITAPVLGGPLDITSGRAEGRLLLTGHGYSPMALLGTLSGRARVLVSDGTLAGVDLAQVRTALMTPPDNSGTGKALRDALSGGTTPFNIFAAEGEINEGTFALGHTEIATNSGAAEMAGTVALASGALDLALMLHPAVPDPPEITIRLNGALGAPVRRINFEELTHWLANRS